MTCNGAEEPERAQRAAIEWVVDQQNVTGGEILLYVPRKGDLDTMNNDISRFAKESGVVVGTWRGHVGNWSGGPVLAVAPTRDKLAEIADDCRVRALCVVPWNAHETAAWEQAVHPELLAGASATTVSPDLDRVVVIGLTYLTHMVNHGNALAGALDHRDAVAVLRTLHRGGYRLPADAVYSWSLANGWPAGGAERLRDIASRIDAGRVVQLKGGSPLRPDVLERWQAEAAEDK
ncbi:MAG: hypothetical protein J2P17_14250 [Mycobacterium sp.]|nr:hypothetical protein [Mycobacterium sp.]